MTTDQQAVEAVVTAIKQSKKYRDTSEATIRQLAVEAVATHKKARPAEKAVRRRLHSIMAPYLGDPDYAAAAELLNQTFVNGDEAAVRALCRDLMYSHPSTRERLPILDTFYATTLAGLPPPGRVLDVACGLNPLARPWLPLPPAAEVIAYDIYSDQIAFLNDFFALAGLPGRAEVRDVAGRPPDEPADLALVLKTLPCLEAIDRRAPERLLDALAAPWLLVSFPAQSLGGRRKGMPAHYEARFRRLLDARGWPAERFAFATELAFLVRKN